MKHRYINSFKSIAVFALLWLTALSVRQANAQITLTIGSGTGTTARFPIYSCYAYNYSQQIYLASELTAAGATGPGYLTKLAFKTSTSMGSIFSNWNSWTVYMGNTATSSFSSSTSWIPLSELTEVWDGTLGTITASTWIEIDLVEPFYWDGTSNIVVAVHEDNPGYSCTQYWASYSAGSTRGLVYYDDYTNPSPGAPPTAKVGPSSTIAQVQFMYYPDVNCEDEPPVAGTLTPDTVCPNQPFSLMVEGSSIGFGYDFIWQLRQPSGTGEWETIVGATDVALTMVDGVSEPTDFRFIAACLESGDADTSNVVTIELNNYMDCYCTPIYTSGCSAGAKINSFVTTGGEVNISNTGTGCSSTTITGYFDYSSEHVVVASIGTTITQSTTVSSYSGGVKVWVDWNHDGVFGDEELVASSASTISAGSTFTSSFTVPATALPGETRMRVRVVESTTTFTACSSQSWGESEDYAFYVGNLTPCEDYDFPIVYNASSSKDIICTTGELVEFQLDGTVPVIVEGITYVWQTAGSASGPWVDISPELETPSFTVESVTDPGYYRCQIRCSGTEAQSTAPIYIEGLTPTTPTVTDVERCGPGPVTLTASTSSGTLYWFENEIGGAPIATGETLEIPMLESTTTYYVSNQETEGVDYQIGTGTSVSTSTGGPFNQWYRRTTSQMMYTAAQLLASGAVAGPIYAISFDMAYPIVYPFPDYTVSVKLVPSSMTTLTWQSDGLTQVFGGEGFEYAPSGSGWQKIYFDQPIIWDGVSNIVIQTCWSQMVDYASSAGGYRYTSVSNQMLYNQTDASGNSCGTTGSTSTSYLPNIIFHFAGCESPRIPVTATVSNVPAPEVESAFRCGPGPLVLNASSVDAATIHWYADESDPTPLATGSSFPIPLLSETQTYFVSAEIDGCESARIPVLAEVRAIPEVAATSAEVCGEGSVTLTASSDAAGTSYSWYESASATTPLYTGSTFTTPTLSTTTSFYVEATRSGCTSERISTLVEVNPLPTITASATDVCITGPSTLTATSDIPGTTFIWYEDAAGTVILGTGDSLTSPGLSASTTFYVRGIFEDCQSEIIPVVVTVYNPSVSGTNMVLCDPGSVELSATSMESDAEILWFTSLASTTPFNTGSTYTTPVLSTTTTYYIQGSYMGCESFKVPVTVEVHNFEFDLVEAEICNHGSMILQADVDDLYATMEWYADEELTTLVHTGTIYVTPDLYETTTYYVVAVTPECTTLPREITAYVRPLPTVSIEPESAITCSGNPVEFNAAVYPGYEYSWSDGTTTPTLTTSQYGEHKLWVTNSFGCLDSGVVFLDTILGPSVDGFDYVPVIFMNPFKYTFSPINPSETIVGYWWDFGDGTTSEEMYPEHEYEAFGTYIVTLYTYNECDTYEVSLPIHVQPASSVEDAQLSEQLDVYPNPAELHLTVSFKGNEKIRKINVYNQLGQLMIAEGVDDQSTYTFNVDRLAQGSYMLIVESASGKMAVKKFVVQ